VLNPRWGGFTREDYLKARESILPSEGQREFSYKDKPVQPGEFDLRGYEIARVQYFQSANDMTVTFSNSELQFSKPCIRKLNNALMVELLFDPINHLFAVRPATNENRHAVVWASATEKWCHTRKIRGTAFLPVMYEILRWKPENKYRIVGTRRQKENEVIILFDLRETEVFIPFTKDPETGETVKQPFELFEDAKPMTTRGKKSVVAFPADWVSNFGTDAYQHEQAREIAAIDRDGKWGVNQQGIPYQTDSTPQMRTSGALAEEINSILTTMTQEEHNE